MKKKPKKEEAWIPFVNNKGEVVIRIKGSWTIADVIRMGIINEVKITEQHAPVADGAAVHVPSHYPKS